MMRAIYERRELLDCPLFQMCYGIIKYQAEKFKGDCRGTGTTG